MWEWDGNGMNQNLGFLNNDFLPNFQHSRHALVDDNSKQSKVNHSVYAYNKKEFLYSSFKRSDIELEIQT